MKKKVELTERNTLFEANLSKVIYYHITSTWLKYLTFEATETKGPDRGKVEREFNDSPDELF